MKFNRYILMTEASDGSTGGDGGGEPPVTEPSGLPSDNPEGSISFEIKPEDLTDGKFQGKWSSPQEMQDHIKTMEDKYATLSRDVSDKSKAQEADIQATADELKTQQAQNTVVQELLPTFLENGMVVTDEMTTKLKEVGLSEDKIKIGAYEFKEALDKNVGHVGGKENYDIIMAYHAENMSDDDKRAFNHSIQNPKNSEALMIGLQTMYEKSLTNGSQEQSTDRFRGDVTSSQSIKPYNSKRELLQDKAYADSRVASSADKAKYKQRLALTPENVWRS